MGNPTNEYLESQRMRNIEKIKELEQAMPEFAKDFFTYYLSIKESQPRTVLNYAFDLSVFFYFLTENNPILSSPKDITPAFLDELRTLDIQEYLAFLESYKKEGKIYHNSAAGKARKLASLRSFYKYMQNILVLKNNPTTLVPSPKIKKKNIILLEQNEVERVVSNVENGTTLTKEQLIMFEKSKLRDRAIILLLLHTGIRVSECVGLDLDDIDNIEHSIRIIRKGGDESYVYVNDEVLTAINQYIDLERPEDQDIEDSDIHALFISKKHTRLSVRAMERMVKKYSAIISNKKITPHKLRSTFATQLYRTTDDIYLVKDALGHKSISSTSHYADIGNDKRKEVPDLIGYGLNLENTRKKYDSTED